MKVEMYKITCEECGKEKIVKEDPYSEHFLCTKCKDKLPEPKREDYSSFMDYFNELEDWEYKTKKQSNYDYSKFKEDVFADYNVKGKKAELAFELAQREHADGLRAVLGRFDDLVELIK